MPSPPPGRTDPAASRSRPGDAVAPSARASRPGDAPPGRGVPIGFVGEALAFVVPLAAYLATASANGYWLDAGELVAAATDLGISHPPGHPLYGLLSFAATLVPLGPVELRVAVLGAVAAAAAALFFYRALLATVDAVGLRAAHVAVPVALAGTWFLAGSAAFWLEGVRPEVYAVQAALTFRVIERLVELDRARPRGGALPLYDASLCFGLALASHHFLALLLLPAAAPTLARVAVARGMRPLAIGALFVAVGLGTYVYLPLRAAAGPTLNLGEPTDLARLYWVVSAEAFQKATTTAYQPLAERFADVAIALARDRGMATPFVALGGAYLALRNAASRRPALLFVLIAAVFVAARAWLGFVRSNPDALGYLVPAFGAVVALATVLVAVFVGLVAGDRPRRPRAVAVALALALPPLAVAHAAQSPRAASLASFVDTDVVADPARRDLPTGAVVLAHDPQTIFHFVGGEATERLRPDVTLVPIPLLTYPGMVDGLLAAHPELTEVLRGYLLHGELRQPDLQSLAAERPLLVEMDLRVPPALYETMVPAGLYHAVLPDGATGGDEGVGRERRTTALAAIERGVPPPPQMDPHTRARLLWWRYTGALYYAGFGDREAAAAEARAGLALNPEARELVDLEAVLRARGDERGPLDVTPFLAF